MMMSIVQAVTITLYSNCDGGVDNKGLCLSLSLCSTGDALCQYFSDSYLADLWCPSP